MQVVSAVGDCMMNDEEWQHYITQAPNGTIQLVRRVECLEEKIDNIKKMMTEGEEVDK